ncbi:MAG: hypothetical protein CME63_01055 [Halobacteriovoraceae bacterium]|nr:hypothetical protein [Halobacteriovoraceae bacterium]|tara:strand:- start:5498 stop:5854 length:357 start_codon:yes stop_codon:yes gene_type:complete
MEFIKTLYHFSNHEFDLIEIKRLDLNDDAPIEDRLHWLLYSKKSKKKDIDHPQRLIKLNFQSMSKDDQYQFRQFNNASLKFSPSSAHLSWNNQNIQLESTKEPFSNELVDALLHFFNK